MTTFILPTDMQIRGDQLVDEILQATGIDLTDRYAFYPPDEVRVPDELVAGHEAEIQAVIDAHVPDPLYFPEDLERQVQRQAEADAAAIPEWAMWTEEQALEWFNTNIADLLAEIPDINGLTADTYRNNAQAIDAQYQDIFAGLVAMNRALARLVIALRNERWPNLEGR